LRGFALGHFSATYSVLTCAVMFRFSRVTPLNRPLLPAANGRADCPA